VLMVTASTLTTWKNRSCTWMGCASADKLIHCLRGARGRAAGSVRVAGRAGRPGVLKAAAADQ
jgi:hypothetical protein